MRQAGETPQQAERKALDFVHAKGVEAQSLQADYARQGGKGLSLTALVSFGAGSHPIMDNTSPTHSGFQEYRIPDNRLVEGAPNRSGILNSIVNTLGKVYADTRDYVGA